MIKDEALRLALEALEKLFGIPDKWTGEGEGDVAVWRLGGSYRAQQAITTIKAALEAKDEPVAWIDERAIAWLAEHPHGSITTKLELQKSFERPTPLYTTPPQQKAKNEPVAWISPTELLVMRGNALGGAKDWRVNVGLKPEEGDVGLYTTPPQRTWVGLTRDEILEARWHNKSSYKFARVLEAKLKERNG